MPADVTLGRGGVNVGYVLTQRARLNPDDVAIRFDDVSLTYAELNQRVNRLATGLARLGVGKSDRVAGLMMNSHHHYEILFACAKLGAILVTVNFRLVADEVRHIIDDSRPTVFIHGVEFVALVDDLRTGDSLPVHTVLVGDGTVESQLAYEAVIRAPATEPETPVGLDDPLII